MTLHHHAQSLIKKSMFNKADFREKTTITPKYFLLNDYYTE